jgi:hypothetical protein
MPTIATNGTTRPGGADGPQMVGGSRDGGHSKDGQPRPTANPLREYLAGSYGGSTGLSGLAGVDGRGTRVLPHSADDLSRQFGSHVYESMLADPAVVSSLNILKQGIMAGGLQLLPAMTADPTDEATDQPGENADKIELAEEIKDFCQRSIDRLERPLDDVLYELLDALPLGVKLAEITWKVATDGPDKGKTILSTVSPKPKESWAFVVDPFGGIIGILAGYNGAWGLGLGTLVADSKSPGSPLAAMLGGYALLPRDKFAILSWQARNGDPRGNSILRSAYNAWQFKLSTWPLLYRYLQLFANPKAIGTTPQQSGGVPLIDNAGNVVPGKENVSAEEAMAYSLANWGSADWLVLPPGATVTVVNAQGDGRAQMNAVEMYNREIALAILGTTRNTMESQYGSRADSETGQDNVGLNVRIGKNNLGYVVRMDILKPLVRANYGDDAAEELTPHVSLGKVDHQDIEKMLQAVAAAGFALDPSQFPKIDATLELPIRKVAKPPELIPVAVDPNAQAQAQPQVGPDGKPVPAGEAGATNNQPPSKGSGGPVAAVSPPGRQTSRKVAPNATTAA